MKRLFWTFVALLIPVFACADLRPPSGGINLGSTLQSGATFYVSSGTVVNFTAGTISASTVTISSAIITNLVGTGTNSTAGAGIIGEFISSTTLVAQAITSGSNNVLSDIAVIYLTPGDWDISGSATATLNGATSTAWDVYILTVSGNNSTGFNVTNTASGTPPTAGANVTLTIPRMQASLSASTSYYLKTDFALSAGNCKSFGTINARRRR